MGLRARQCGPRGALHRRGASPVCRPRHQHRYGFDCVLHFSGATAAARAKQLIVPQLSHRPGSRRAAAQDGCGGTQVTTRFRVQRQRSSPNASGGARGAGHPSLLLTLENLTTSFLLDLTSSSSVPASTSWYGDHLFKLLI